MICKSCNKRITNKKHKFCSLLCYWKSLKGKPTWNKQKRIKVKCLFCGKKIIIREKEQRKYCSRKCYEKAQVGKAVKKRGGKVKFICENCFKSFEWWRYDKDRKFCSRKCRGIALSKSLKWNKENNPNWNGGKSRGYRKGYKNDRKYREWRTAVFKRDNYTCQECGTKGCYLEPHHIKSWAKYPNLRYEVSNGRTLCKKCHSKTDSFRRKST